MSIYQYLPLSYSCPSSSFFHSCHELIIFCHILYISKHIYLIIKEEAHLLLTMGNKGTKRQLPAPKACTGIFRHITSDAVIKR